MTMPRRRRRQEGAERPLPQRLFRPRLRRRRRCGRASSTTIAAPACRRRCTSTAGTRCARRWSASRIGTATRTKALMIQYVDPLTGGPVFKTITFFAQMLRPGERTRAAAPDRRACWSAPFQGRGHSMVDGKRFDWTEFDTLAVPGGSWCEHVNGSETEPAILFVASDEPALKAFGLFRQVATWSALSTAESGERSDVRTDLPRGPPLQAGHCRRAPDRPEARKGKRECFII